MTAIPNVQTTSNPLARLSQAELRSVIRAYRLRCDELLASAEALLNADEAQEDPLLSWGESERLIEALAMDEQLARFDSENRNDAASLERVVALTFALRSKTYFTLAEVGWEPGPYEVEALNLTLEAQWRAFNHYRAAGRELRLDLARLIDQLEVASGRASLADPLEWRALDGPLAELIDDCTAFFAHETYTMSIGWVEEAVQPSVRLREALNRSGEGAN